MLREILNELFRPPYDIIQILMITLIVLLGLYTCSMIIWSFRCHSEKQKIRRFFSAHKSTTGVIIKYDAADGDKYITVSSAVPGQAVPFVPHVHETADQYTVILECHTGDAHFYAEYQIPLSDYKGEKEGETVRIKDSWRPIGYEEI
nr:hypothetical protein [uncultured Acetatifactor sp.]